MTNKNNDLDNYFMLLMLHWEKIISHEVLALYVESHHCL